MSMPSGKQRPRRQWCEGAGDASIAPEESAHRTGGGQVLPIFDLNLASTKRASGPHGTVVASNIKLTVTSQAAIALNGGLGVRTFKAGTNLGIATLTVAYARGHR